MYKFFFICAFIFSCLPLKGQEEKENGIKNKFELSAQFNLISPLSYWRMLKNSKFQSGMSIAVGGRIPSRNTLYTGLDFSIKWLGISYLKGVMDNGRIYDYETYSKFADITVYGKYELKQLWYIIPYVKARMGLRIATTKTEVYEILLSAEDPLETFVDNRDASLLMSVGGGINVPFTENFSMVLGLDYEVSTKMDYYIVYDEDTGINQSSLDSFFLITGFAKSLSCNVGLVLLF